MELSDEDGERVAPPGSPPRQLGRRTMNGSETTKERPRLRAETGVPLGSPLGCTEAIMLAHGREDSSG